MKNILKSNYNHTLKVARTKVTKAIHARVTENGGVCSSRAFFNPIKRRTHTRYLKDESSCDSCWIHLFYFAYYFTH
jgi:MinD superfamily P-loop ATPase